jgi:hypothetical protein
MDRFLILLAVTTAVRGLGAGLIYDVALVSLPVRRQIGAIPYAKYARALYMSNGVKTYATVSILGALLTIAVTAGAFVRGDSAIVSWSIAISMIATVIAIIGTSRALPAVLSLRQAPDNEALLNKILDRFAYWHTFSTVWQLVAFIALVVALTNQS